jgi:hypothetical protein
MRVVKPYFELFDALKLLVSRFLVRSLLDFIPSEHEKPPLSRFLGSFSVCGRGLRKVLRCPTQPVSSPLEREHTALDTIDMVCSCSRCMRCHRSIQSSVFLHKLRGLLA